MCASEKCNGVLHRSQLTHCDQPAGSEIYPVVSRIMGYNLGSMLNCSPPNFILNRFAIWGRVSRFCPSHRHMKWTILSLSHSQFDLFLEPNGFCVWEHFPALHRMKLFALCLKKQTWGRTLNRDIKSSNFWGSAVLFFQEPFPTIKNTALTGFLAVNVNYFHPNSANNTWFFFEGEIFLLPKTPQHCFYLSRTFEKSWLIN